MGWFVDRVLPGLVTSAVWTLALWLSHRRLRRHITRTADKQTAELSGKPETPERDLMSPMHGGHLWRDHKGVRTGDQLSLGERAADRLKAAFGSWAFLIVLNSLIVVWVVLNVVLPHADRWDIYPFILLNLGLSWLAAQQGGALQIAANRGDRINSEVALHTQANSDALISMNQRQLEILNELTELRSLVAGKDPQ